MPQASMPRNPSPMSWVMHVAVLHRRTPRTGNPRPHADENMPGNVTNERKQSLDALELGHIMLLGAPQGVATASTLGSLP